MRTDTRDLRHDYAVRRDGTQDQRSIIQQRADLRADAQDIHRDDANLRSTEQNLRAQRDKLSAERQDLRKDEGGLRADHSRDLRYASAGDLRGVAADDGRELGKRCGCHPEEIGGHPAASSEVVSLHLVMARASERGSPG
jgi:hypothetical protein